MVIQTEEAKDLEALYVSSNSRPLPPQEAYARVKKTTEVLKKCGVKYFSKKIDSTLRGGIGYEVDAMLDTLGKNTVAIMVAAIPTQGSVSYTHLDVYKRQVLNIPSAPGGMTHNRRRNR